MLRIDPTLNHVPARREHVVALFESINQPLVNIPNYGASPTGAYLLGTRNEHGFYTVFVYLHQPESRALLLYVSEPRNLSAEQYRAEEAEAVRFVESMGFMLDSLQFRQLSAADQDAIMARVPLFRPPVSILELCESPDEVAFQVGVGGADVFGGLGTSGGDFFRRAGLGPTSGYTNAAKAQAHDLAGQGLAIVGQGPSFPGQGQTGHGPPALDGLGSGPVPQHLGRVAGAGFSQQGSQMFAQGLGTGPAADLVTSGVPSQVPMPSTGRQGQTSGLPSSHGAQVGPVSTQVGPVSAQVGPGSTQVGPVSAQVGPGSTHVLERIGRFLAAFGLLLALMPCAGCKTVTTETGASDAQAQVDLGEQQLAARQFPEAIRTFEGIIAEDPKDKFALRGAGLAYMSLGRKEPAEAYYRRALAVDAKWSEPKNELATLLVSDKRCEEAESLLREVVADVFYATPEYGENNLALALACQGKRIEAIRRLETLVLKRPLFCLGYLTLSQLSVEAKEPEVTVKACEDFEQHCARNEKIRDLVAPDHQAVCYLRSGMAYAEMGDVESARASLMRCQTNGSVIGKECRRALEMLPN